MKRTKNYSGNGEFFKILIFYFSDWSFSIFNSAFSFPTISSLFLEVKMQIIYEFLTRVYTAHLVYSIPYEYFRCCTSLILVSWSIASFKIIALFRGLFNISKIFVMLKCLPILNLLKQCVTSAPGSTRIFLCRPIFLCLVVRHFSGYIISRE